jgi:Mg2+/citrate symporter
MNEKNKFPMLLVITSALLLIILFIFERWGIKCISMNDDLMKAIGYIMLFPLSLLLGITNMRIINWISNRYKVDDDDKKTENEETNNNVKKLANINGLIEISMYSFSILVKIQLFIAFWIGVKTAIKWDYERKAKDTKDVDYSGTKLRYLRFLIGNALNVIISYLIAVAIKGVIIGF